jgi:hypothetical protein
LGTLAIIGWVTAITVAGSVVPVDQAVLQGLARLRTPALTRVMVAVAEVADALVIVLGWAAVLVLVVVRRLRRLVVFLGTFWLVQLLATYLARGILEQASPLRPAGIALLGPAGLSAYPLVPVAMRRCNAAIEEVNRRIDVGRKWCSRCSRQEIGTLTVPSPA